MCMHVCVRVYYAHVYLYVHVYSYLHVNVCACVFTNSHIGRETYICLCMSV